MLSRNSFNILKKENFEWFRGEVSEDNMRYYRNSIPKESMITALCHGSTKMVLVYDNYVIKIPFDAGFAYANGDNKHCWDYCATEIILYKEAEKYHLEDMFCKVRYLGDIEYHPIYIQEKAEILDYTGYKSKEDSVKTAYIDKICCDCKYSVDHPDAYLWLLDVYNYYGKNKFKRFIKFLKKHPYIDDLHGENVGYIGDRPVLIDYAGFRD